MNYSLYSAEQLQDKLRHFAYEAKTAEIKEIIDFAGNPYSVYDGQALIIASELGYKDLVEFLIQFEALPNRNFIFNQSFHMACQNSRLSVIDYFLSSGKIHESRRELPLITSAIRGDIKLLEFMLQTLELNYSVVKNALNYERIEYVQHLVLYHNGADLVEDALKNTRVSSEAQKSIEDIIKTHREKTQLEQSLIAVDKKRDVLKV